MITFSSTLSRRNLGLKIVNKSLYFSATKMPSFPGSSFFSDTEFLKRRAFLSSHYNLPLFIYSSKFLNQQQISTVLLTTICYCSHRVIELGRPKNYNHRNRSFLRKQLRRYTKIYSQSGTLIL